MNTIEICQVQVVSDINFSRVQNKKQIDDVERLTHLEQTGEEKNKEMQNILFNSFWIGLRS